MSSGLADSASLSSPHDLSSRYEVVKRLGQGGMGEVFLCHKLGIDGKRLKLVVLKRVLPHLADRKKATDQFMSEMATAATLEHRNIVRVADWGQFRGSNCFEMELVNGMSAEDLLQRRSPDPAKQVLGPLPAVDVAWIGMQTCLGLAYAHTRAVGNEAGIVHRDIAPDNLMLTIEGEVKIADWGVAKPLMSSDGMATGTHHAIGKAHYMAPEQWAGQPLDGRADLYALGVTLTLMLTGHQVYPTREGESILLYIQRVVSAERPSAREMLPNAPPALQDIIERMLSKNRDNRPPGAEALVQPFSAIARELGGDLYSVQKAFAARVAEHHASDSLTQGPRGSTPPSPAAPSPEPHMGRQHTGPMTDPAPFRATPPTAQLAHGDTPGPIPRAGIPSPPHLRQPLPASAPPAKGNLAVLWTALAGSVLVAVGLAVVVGILYAGGLPEDRPVASSPSAAGIAAPTDEPTESQTASETGPETGPADVEAAAPPAADPEPLSEESDEPVAEAQAETAEEQVQEPPRAAPTRRRRTPRLRPQPPTPLPAPAGPARQPGRAPAASDFGL